MTIRRATLDDVGPIAAIHVHAWQAAYEGIVPKGFLASLSIAERERVWREMLERRTVETWVAEEGGVVRGWVSAARSRDADASPSTGEIWAVYVDPRSWRRGVGRRLCREAEARLVALGCSEVTLWVLKENVRATAFYASMGFAVDPGREKVVTRGGAGLPEIRLRKALDGSRPQPDPEGSRPA